MIQLEGVTKTYPVGGGLTVLRDVHLSVEAGEYVGILGTSGSGKSTLLHIMGLLDRPTSGTVRVGGDDVGGLNDAELSSLRGRSIGFVFQSFHLVSQLSVLENVELPLFYQRLSKREQRRRARECLDAVRLTQRADHFPGQLSGGEAQRTAIARAIAAEPDLILADEPTGNLDSKTGEEIIAVLEDLHARGCTVIIVTHDRSIAARMPRIVRISDGMIEGDGPP